MKKILLVLVIFFIFLPQLALADERCPDYCSEGTLYTGRTYSLRTSSCSDPTSRLPCDYGCDGREKCAAAPTNVPTRTILPTSEPTPTPQPSSTTAPIQTGECPNKCERGTFYFNGTFDASERMCKYTSEEKCNSGACERDGLSCEKKQAPPTCDQYCSISTLYFNGVPTADGKCSYSEKMCESGCSSDNSKSCSVEFKIGPARFTDPKDNKVKPIPEALVKIGWIFEQNGLIKYEEKAGYKTDLKGIITIPGTDLYRYIDKATSQVVIQVALQDYRNRFQIMDETTEKSIPYLKKTILVSDPKTYSIDFNFDISPDDRRNAKIYYHNWEAVTFSEDILGVKISSWAPEMIRVDSKNTCGACHSNAYIEKTDTIIDYGIDYTSPTKLKESNSPENLEWHEFCHHIMLEQYGNFPPWGKPCGCGGYCNHCGYGNATSADSFIEGWAEFCALAIKSNYKYKDPQIYAGFGSLEVNNDVITSEEFAVASTLWDLFDPPAGDGIELSIQQIWGVLRKKYLFKGETVQRYIQNFNDVYQAFNNSSLPNLKGDINKNGINNLDELYTERGCYIDSNHNMKWGVPEPIGVTLWLNPKKQNKPPDVIRPNRPYKPGAYIGVSLKDRNNKVIENGEAKISVAFQNNSCGLNENCDYEYTAPIENGKIYMEPPAQNFDATITIRINAQEKNIQLASFTAKDYWKKYNPSKKVVDQYNLMVDTTNNIPAGKVYVSKVIAKATKDGVIIESTQLTGKTYMLVGFKNVRLFRLIPMKMKVEMEVDRQSGSTLLIKKPWWHILAG